MLNLNQANQSAKSVHQEMMDLAYAEWKTTGVEPAKQDSHKLFKLAVMVGNMNYQVCNGGWIQYFDNGYASAETSGFANGHEEIDRHNEFMGLFNQYGLQAIENGREVYKLMDAFSSAFEIDDEQYTEEWIEAEDEDEEDRYEECYNENYGEASEYCQVQWESLNGKFYAINDKFLAAFETFLRQQISPNPALYLEIA